MPVTPFCEASAEENSSATADDQNAAFDYYRRVEAGWRVFTERPSKEDRTNNRAKFEEYGQIPPGPFVNNLYWGGVAKDGSKQFDFWANNIGYNNQNYLLQAAKPGNLYLTLEWDQTPHLYGFGQTLFNTSNPAVLTIDPTVRAALGSGSTTQRAAVINANVHPVELGIQRDTAKVSTRYTPDPDWEFKTNYSHEKRTGDRPFGTNINGFNSIETIAPVDYTTHDFGASAEYFRNFGNNKRGNIQFSYNGSIFENANKSFTWDNPFPPDGGSATQGRNSLPPDNQAHRFTATSGVDLPFDTRYMGTMAYSMMRQNDLFIPKTINPDLLAKTAPLPAPSLNGAIDTILINNVLTTRINSDLTSTLRYRYYDNNNRTPELLFTDYVLADGKIVQTDRQNLPVSYTKQNAGADLKWRLDRTWAVGGGFGWERYDRDRREVDVTDEFSGKVFVDASPWNWWSFRTSYINAQRRFNDYDALKFVGVQTAPPDGKDFLQNPLMRIFDLTNRNRNKVEASTDLTVAKGWIVTPTFGWRHDEFSDNLVTSTSDLGLKDEQGWNAGLDTSIAVNSRVKLFASYMHEDFRRVLVNRQNGNNIDSNGGGIGDPASAWASRIHDGIDTITAGVNVKFTDNIDLNVSYVYTRSNDKTDTFALGAAGVTSDPAFPEVKNRLHRVDAVLSNKFDPDLVRQWGWTGDVTAKVRYVYEQNRMTNWQIDNVVPYMEAIDSGARSSLFLAALNPNYTAQLIALSLAYRW
jgi:MtrB/PioB family decaheme-associated outer membrane protein